MTAAFEPVETRDNKGSEQRIYRLGNGYGVSAIGWAPGSGRIWWDVAVIRWRGETWTVVFDTPVNRELLDSLSDEEVQDVLTRLSGLPTCAKCNSAPPARGERFCEPCISRCHESTDFAHECVICAGEESTR
jgi:hypothetical protein